MAVQCPGGRSQRVCEVFRRPGAVWTKLTNSAREIPRPARENAGLRDDAGQLSRRWSEWSDNLRRAGSRLRIKVQHYRDG